jgi:hypothetical protein
MKPDNDDSTKVVSISNDVHTSEDSECIDSPAQTSSQATPVKSFGSQTQLSTYPGYQDYLNVTESYQGTSLSTLSNNYLVYEFRNNRPKREFFRLQVSL